MVVDKLKEIIQLQYNIKLDNLVYTTKTEKHNFSRYSLPIVFLIHKEYTPETFVIRRC